MKYLRSFGEMAVIAISDGKKMGSKLDTRCRAGIFVGYDTGNEYRFINIQTKKIILSKEIQWLNSFWKQYKKRNDNSKKFVEDFSQMMRMIRPWKKVKQKRTRSVEENRTDRQAFRPRFRGEMLIHIWISPHVTGK